MSDKQLPQYTKEAVDHLGNSGQSGSYQLSPPIYDNHTPAAPVGYLSNAPQHGSVPHHHYGYHPPPPHAGYQQSGIFQTQPHIYGYHLPPRQMYPYPGNSYYADLRPPLNVNYAVPPWGMQPPVFQGMHTGGSWVTNNAEITNQNSGQQADSPRTQSTTPSDPEETNMETVSAKQDATERVYNSFQDATLSREIEVRGIPDNATEEMMLNFFENERKGGGPVDDIKYSKSDHTAIVTFESPESANTVLKRQPCILLGKTLNINARTTSGVTDYMTPVKATSKGGNSDEKDDTSSVCVRGFEKTATEDSVIYYFENKRRSGGGEISSFEINREEGYICITFDDSSDAAEVVKRSHTLDGATLIVRPHVLDKHMVLLTGLTSVLSEETLSNFMEAKVNEEVQSVTFSDDQTKAIVKFVTPCDINKIKEICAKHKLGGSHVTVLHVPSCYCIRVTGLPSKITEETLLNYFENTRRSGGGTVERVELDPNEAVGLVYFQDHQVVGEVCKKTHEIEKTPVEVHPYQSCLGKSRGEKRKKFPPAPVTLNNLDQDKMKFLMKNSCFRKKLENGLAKLYSRVIWQSNQSDNVLLECTLTCDIENHLLLAELWQDKCLDCFNSFLKALQSRVFQSNAQDWGEMLERLKRLQLSDEDKVEVLLEETNYTVTLVGDTSVMPASIKHVEDVFAVKLVTKKFSLKKWQLQYLLAISFMEEIKNSDCNVVFEINEGEIKLTGVENSVSEASIQMHEKLNKVVKAEFVFLPETLNLLQKDNIQAEIAETLRASKLLNYAWEVRDGHLYVYTNAEEEASVVKEVIESMISKFSIQLHKDIHNICHDPDWKKLKERMYLRYPNRMLICDEMPGEVTVFSVSNIIANIKEELERYFAEHVLHSKVLELDKGVVRFIQSHAKAEIDQYLQEASKGKILKINFESLSAITVTGTKANLKAGKQMILSLEKQIKKQQHTIRKQGIGFYIRTPKGEECIKKAEEEAQSVIELKGIQKQREEIVTAQAGREWVQKRQDFRQVTKCAKAKLSCGVKIKVLGGDITELKVDVMVNAANSKLEHEAGLAAALVRKGGRKIQDECTEYVKTNGVLSDGDVYIGSSGNLKCKALVHAVGPKWKDGESGESKILIRTISNCMHVAQKLKAVSIVFPAVCAGIFGFSPEKACTAIVDSICNFFEEQKGNAGIREVYLCDINRDCVFCFMQALEKKLGKNKIKVLLELHPDSRSVSNQGENANGSEVVSNGRRTRTSTHLMFGKTQVRIVKAVLAKEYSDVIVNSVSKKLRLETGHLSKTLLKKGGEEIQDECNSRYPNGIQYGDIAITGSGKLPCKKILHAALPAWDGNKDSALKALVLKCLVEADKMKMNSISIPPIGTGDKRYPKDLVANEMLQAVYDFCHQKQTTCIRSVRIVVFYKDEDVMEVFENAKRSWLPKLKESGVRPFKNIFFKIQHWTKAGDTESESKTDKDGLEPGQGDSSLDMVIYARSEQDIKKAISIIERTMDSEWSSMSIEDPGIKYLNQTLKDDIYRTGKDNNVNIKIDAKKGEIQLMGFFLDVMPISDRIHKILRKQVEKYHAQKEAQLLSVLVQWFYIKDGKEVKFSADTNITIEKAFQAKCNSVKIQDRSGDQYKINFDKMVEKPVKDSSKKFPVIRRDLIDKGSLTAEKPKHWSDMKSNENLKIVPLKTSDPEYIKVVQDFHTSVGSPRLIVKVERVQNLTLHTQYMAKKRHMHMQNSRKDNERVLWHGTPVTAVDSINAHGFNRSFCKSAWNGVYFAVQASYSAGSFSAPDSNGDKRIYQCRVLTGDYAQGQGTMRIPPPKSHAQPHILYDSVVNNVQSPSMFVIFHDAQAYPDYLITFK